MDSGFTHGDEIGRDADVDQHDVEVGTVVRTKDIGAIRVQLAASLDLVKEPHRPQDKIDQIFFNPENQRKPLFTGKQDGE